MPARAPCRPTTRRCGSTWTERRGDMTRARGLTALGAALLGSLVPAAACRAHHRWQARLPAALRGLHRGSGAWPWRRPSSSWPFVTRVHRATRRHWPRTPCRPGCVPRCVRWVSSAGCGSCSRPSPAGPATPMSPRSSCGPSAGSGWPWSARWWDLPGAGLTRSATLHDMGSRALRALHVQGIAPQPYPERLRTLAGHRRLLLLRVAGAGGQGGPGPAAGGRAGRVHPDHVAGHGAVRPGRLACAG